MKKVIEFLRRIRVGIAWVVMVGAFVALCAIGLRFVDYSLPMLRGDNDRALERVYLGDLSVPHFNRALALYEQNDFQSARKGMEACLAECVGSDGQLKESHRQLAAECQFYIGNAWFNSKKTAEAVAAYEECLKLNPGHLWAKYNLEKLQESQPQKPQGGGGAGKPARKI